MTDLRERIKTVIRNEIAAANDETWENRDQIEARVDRVIAALAASEPGEPLYRRCLRCNGDRQVERYVSSYHKRLVPCSACQGEGYLPATGYWLFPAERDALATVLAYVAAEDAWDDYLTSGASGLAAATTTVRDDQWLAAHVHHQDQAHRRRAARTALTPEKIALLRALLED